VAGVVVRLYGTCPSRLARLPISMRDYRGNPAGLIAPRSSLSFADKLLSNKIKSKFLRLISRFEADED